MNYKIKKAFGKYKVGYETNTFYEIPTVTIALLEHCGFIEPITEWSADGLKEGDEYWYMDSYGDISNRDWDGYTTDLFRLKSKNIYRTKEEAEEAYKRIMNS